MEIRYDFAFMFKYSAREGTKAYKWGDTLSDDEKGCRLQEIIALQERISGEVNQHYVGQAVKVLIEGPAKRQADWLSGKNGQFKTVVFPSNGAQPGTLVSVRVNTATAHTIGQRCREGSYTGNVVGRLFEELRTLLCGRSAERKSGCGSFHSPERGSEVEGCATSMIGLITSAYFSV